MTDSILPLVGVLIGAVLTVAGQVLLAGMEDRKRRRTGQATITTAARMQGDAFWTFQNLAARALVGGPWPEPEQLRRYEISREDMTIMAAAVSAEVWKLYSSAVRAQADCILRSADAPQPGEHLASLLGAYIRTEQARVALHDTFDGASGTFPHTCGPVALSRHEISQVLDETYVLTLDKSVWLERLDGPAPVDGSADDTTHGQPGN